MDMKAIGDDVAELIGSGDEDERLAWKGPDCVEVLIARIVPAGPAQSVQYRRKKLRETLSAILATDGWTLSLKWILRRQNTGRS
jgi:hypothetical protein